MRFGGILLAAALILGGCTDDPAPREPTKTASSPHPSSTLKPPVMPEQAKEDSPEGAAAFVAHWIRVSNYAAATGDTRALSKLSGAGCEGCRRYIDLYRTTYEKGGYFVGGDWAIGNAKVAQASEAFVVTMQVTWSKSIFRKSRSDEERSDGPGADTLTFEVRDGQVRQMVQGQGT